MPWYYMGQTYGTKLNRQHDAERAFERAVSLRARWPEAWNALGFVESELKDYNKAIVAFQHAVDQMSTRANYWNSLAAAYSFANRWPDCIATLHQEQQRMKSTVSWVDWYNLGLGFQNTGQFRDAVTAYSQSIRLDSGHGTAWNSRGAVHQTLGNNAAALQDYQRAAALGDPYASGNYSRLKSAMSQAQARGGSQGCAVVPQICLNAIKQMNYDHWNWSYHAPGETNPYSSMH